MNGIIISIAPTGEETITVVNVEPTLDMLKTAIGGGSIEIVPYFNRFTHDGRRRECVAFCDEDGKNKGMPYNTAATKHWLSALQEGKMNVRLMPDGRIVNLSGGGEDYLVGKIAVVLGDRAFLQAL